jgi:hypothetical protein
MAFILVFILLKPEDHSSMPSQIILLHVQSKVRNSIAAMQALHGVWQNFVKFYSLFRRAVRGRVAFLARLVVFCKCKKTGLFRGVGAKAIGGCSLFVLALVAGRKTGTRCGSSALIRA